MSRCCWKNGANRLARHKVATNLLFIKKMKYLQSAIKQSAIRPGVPTQGHFIETKQLPMGRDGDRRPPPGSLSPVLFPHGLSPLFFSAYLLRFLASLGLLSFSVFSLVCMQLKIHPRTHSAQLYPFITHPSLAAISVPPGQILETQIGPVHPPMMSHPWVRCLYNQLSARRQGHVT